MLCVICDVCFKLAVMEDYIKRVAALLVIVGGTLFAPLIQAQTAKAVAAKSFPSVVLLLMEDSQGQPFSLGSGFFVEGGYVATNAHVIRGASRGIVKLVGKSDKAEIIGIAAADTERDLVLLAVKGLSGPSLPLGKSKSTTVGEEIYAIGNPQGLEGTISQGIVSGVRRIANTEILQITAPISPGSSGGPVLDQKGQVIGVAVATFREGQNLNFAIPIDYLSALLQQPKVSAPLRALTAKQQSKSVLSEMGPKSTEGVVSSALLCSDAQYSSTVTCSWSLEVIS
jgi:S1-C subfamily serine protease